MIKTPRPRPLVVAIGLHVAATMACPLSLFPSLLFGGDIDFGRDVRPILSEHCFACHGPDAETRHADLRLDEADSAASVIRPGSVDDSELVRRIHSDDVDQVMPPPDLNKSLSAAQKAILEQWIEEGAEFSGHWAFRPIDAPSPPVSPGDRWSANPIDAFVLRTLRRQDLPPSPTASPATLIRRVTLDLTGLPPTPDQIDAFVNDRRDGAWRDLIDRLMRDPAYGEHMAVPWLEAARYADTDGYQNDRYRYQHVWRDWVIDAFNSHMPYDQFVIEQLAGDMLPGATLRQQIASGFNRNHRINSEDGSIPEEWRTEYVADRVDTFGTIFLGLTIGCARCHDHKYDPISHEDYYRLFAYFNNVTEWGVGPNNGNSPPFIEVPPSWPLIDAQEDQAIAPEPVKLRRSRETEGNGLRRPQAGSPRTVMVMHESETPRETFVLLRGQYDQPDPTRPVAPGVPAAIGIGDPASVGGRPSDRLELARWLFRDDHPLTARVAVNRIWKQFFGVGLVASADNFGVQGSLPSHPELLDFLAGRFIQSGWDVQAIQRMILTSNTYRQSAAWGESAPRDPQNRWLSRFPRRRMSAYMLRDQALAASGLLVHRVGGPSVKPYMPPKIWSSMSNNQYVQDSGDKLFRRSLYTYWRRTIPPPTMVNFNAATREVCTVDVQPTNTPLQALTLLNNKIFVEASRWLAHRMLTESDAPIEYGFLLICGRKPSDREAESLRQTHHRFVRDFENDAKAAKQLLSIGESAGPHPIDVTRHAAMTMTASLILNLDEAVTKP